jgi:uncharacterized repeat protein (TIGR01451 family)
MMQKVIIPVLLAATLLAASTAFAAGKVTISIAAEKEVVINKEVKRIPVKETVPGDILIYTLTYRNSGDETATNVLVEDPIPQGTVYLSGTAFGASDDISFSIDKGKSFKKPSLLTYDVKLPNGRMEKRTASTEEYTNIRWNVKSVAPGASGKAGFKVKVK